MQVCVTFEHCVVLKKLRILYNDIRYNKYDTDVNKEHILQFDVSPYQVITVAKFQTMS